MIIGAVPEGKTERGHPDSKGREWHAERPWERTDGRIKFIIAEMRGLLLLVVAWVAAAQTCLKYTGEAVAWWVVLKVPPKIGKTGFGYYDSTMRTGKFVYYDIKVDIGNTALTKTLELINSGALEHVAWNDEKPTG